jgi:hypothetical protein
VLLVGKGGLGAATAFKDFLLETVRGTGPGGQRQRARGRALAHWTVCGPSPRKPSKRTPPPRPRARETTPRRHPSLSTGHGRPHVRRRRGYRDDVTGQGLGRGHPDPHQ